ncbi:ROK family protein [Pedobacter polaris]|uniref:ROK family protein n=1 Tax=Pedobacter polaris TaxID=2571273 RepID=A0A4U1CYS0_9SPHI|nr:ROK family protein [Pedobacter polaris]TKC12819.1 ROK family protein [Pedobacter polaris]
MMNNDSIAIGADIGGTHITAALVDLKHRKILSGSTIREKVDSHASYDQIVEVWSRAILKAKKDLKISKVCLAMPGPFDYEKGICLIKDQNKYEKLYGLNIKELLASKLNNEPADISMVNDAASFLQGEVFGGAASGFEKAIGITLGTGLGSCIYENGVASNANLWQLPFKQGVAEDYLSTRWFTRRYYEITGININGVKELTELVGKDLRVKRIFNEFGHNLGDFLTDFVASTQPEVVVLGGNIAKSFKLFKGALFANIQNRFPNIKIKVALLGEEAALMGAASYWKNNSINLHN